VNYLHELGGRQEAALLAAGLGLEHFLDLRQDAIDAAAHRETGTPRTIEGPLYVANAPLAEGHARMDDGSMRGSHVAARSGLRYPGPSGRNAIVDIWHANTLGTTRSSTRARVNTTCVAASAPAPMAATACAASCLRLRLPAGWSDPKLLNQLASRQPSGAYSLFVSAPGHKHLTSQINLNGDKYLWDDFAFATRDGLIADPVKSPTASSFAQRKLDGEHTEVRFDFTLCKA
jgi:catechol 1,2-dioxygenase